MLYADVIRLFTRRKCHNIKKKKKKKKKKLMKIVNIEEENLHIFQTT